MFNRLAVWRFWPALISLLLPLIFALFVLNTTMRFLLPPIDDWPAFAQFITPGFDTRVADIQGRTSFTVASSYIRVVAIVVIVVAYPITKRRFGVKLALCALISAILAGGIIGKHVGDNDIMLANVVRNVLTAAQHSKAIPVETVERTQMTITINMVLGVSGVVSLLVAFAATAVRAQPQELTASGLRNRLADLQIATLCGAILLVLLVIVGKTLIEWPQGLMNEVGRKSFGLLSASVVNAWGATGTAILLGAVLPAFYSLKADIDLAASSESGEDVKLKQDWMQSNRLEFAPVSLISAAITTATPMLTGPALDIIGSLAR